MHLFVFDNCIAIQLGFCYIAVSQCCVPSQRGSAEVTYGFNY